MSVTGEDDGTVSVPNGEVAVGPAAFLLHVQRCLLRSDTVIADGKGLFPAGEAGAADGHDLLCEQVRATLVRAIDPAAGKH